MTSIVLISILASFAGAQQTAYYPTPTTQIVLPTVPFTGQALLTGTCTLPQYTALYFPDGGILQVPLIGCSDDRPECCPSLNTTHAEPAATSSEDESATTSWTGTTPSPTATGVISMLSNAPLTVCPKDMVDLDPVCCPIGYKQYGQSIIGNLPCVSTLTSTVIAVPSTFLASISSAVAASLGTSTTSAAPTVSVIVNEVFALGLPCADQEAGSSSSGLSTGAKAGIGAAVGAAGLLAIVFFAWLCFRRRKHRREAAATQARTGTAYSEAGNPKNVSTMSSFPSSPPLAPGQMHAFSPQMPMHPQQQGYPGIAVPMPPYGMPIQPHPQAYPYPQPYSPPFGYPQQQPMPAYGYGYPTHASISPPPPLYGPGTPSVSREMKPVEVDAGPVRRNTAPVSAETPAQSRSGGGGGPGPGGGGGGGSVVEMGTGTQSSVSPYS